jgi:hypothetical protein
MTTPLLHLPKKFQKIILSLKAKKVPPGIIFFTLGLLATIWFLIRVIPKPSRATYPCMQVAAPLMSGLGLYLIGLGSTVMAFKRFRYYFARSANSLAMLFLVVAVMLYILSDTRMPVNSYAGIAFKGVNDFTPNDPIGEAQGIFPGRVVWMWDPDATNENCTNTSNGNGVIDSGDDAWFMEMNNNEMVIDSMVIKSVIALTGATDNSEAWDLLFRYYNTSHGNGNIGYTEGQKIFIKINATSAYGGLEGGHYYTDLSRTDDITVNPFISETDPWLVLSVLRQLINCALVPENMIYIGDPARNIYKEFYDLWHGEFPDVNYFGNNLIHTEIDIESLGRTPVAVMLDDKVFFSDQGTVMPEAVTDKLFTIFEDMDYLINIPAMKAHSAAGISLAAKNHFGSFTREWALHLHDGLMGNYDNPVRLGYGLYRVQTDIMMHNLLSGKNLLIIVDGLYPGEEAGGVPYKWMSIPFEDDWCSSIFMSLDPVAIESVCHDFLRTEYNGPTIAESRPNWFGVDDYLHQAADSVLWAEGITYDPDNDGILIASLGVHEHWNDSLHKQYTRNLETGLGIELFKAHEMGTGFALEMNQLKVSVYPNPVTDFIRISSLENRTLEYSLIDMDGRVFLNGKIINKSVKEIDMSFLNRGVYVFCFQDDRNRRNIKVIRH